MRYSFDDMYIGEIKEGGHALFTKLIPRPYGLSRSAWYDHAGSVCKLLNKYGKE